jgi:hypothetical protein
MASVDQSILFINNLSYQLPTPSSVVTNRVLKRAYFQNRNYASENTMICQFNTGSDSVNTKNSKLVLKVKATNPDSNDAGATFGSGSAMNFVKNIRIYHRSGTTYTNTQKMNLFRAKVDHIKESSTWFSSIGDPLMGYNRGIEFVKESPNDPHATQYVEIPLDKLHPFFDPHGGCLLPNQIAAGLRVEIDLENPLTVFQQLTSNANPITVYIIEDFYFDLESYSLMDSAQASLNTTASTKSLEYLYTDIFTSQNSNPSLNSQVNIDINKSVALADSVIGCVQAQASINVGTQDTFATPYVPGSWWFMLGSNQYPLQKVDVIKSAYAQALLTFDKFSHSNNDSALVYAGANGGFSDKFGIYSQSLERDTSLALSASPVNASRSLRFELTFDAPINEPLLITIFLQYLSSSRSTLLNSRVDI